MENSKIEWCRHTANLWIGCTNVHQGCDHCYAEAMAHRWKKDVWGLDKPRIRVDSVWSNLGKWQRLASAAGEIHLVFVGSMMDIFEKEMPLIDSKGQPDMNANTGNLRFHLFYRIDRGDYPNLLFLFLTKRETNINKMIFESWKTSPPDNVMFGASVVNQETFDRVKNNLQAVKGRKFLSMEPQLGPIIADNFDGISWLIQGGESGHHKRPFRLEWARSMRDQCAAHRVPYFFKQIDKIQPIPDDLLVRQFPPLRPTLNAARVLASAKEDPLI